PAADLDADLVHPRLHARVGDVDHPVRVGDHVQTAGIDGVDDVHRVTVRVLHVIEQVHLGAGTAGDRRLDLALLLGRAVLGRPVHGQVHSGVVGAAPAFVPDVLVSRRRGGR